MNSASSRWPRAWLIASVLAPLGLGALLLVIATQLYPGGTWWDPEAEGFHWRHNFWCDLLREVSHGGRSNQTGALWARAGLLAIAAGFASFWPLVATRLAPSRAGARFVLLSGSLGACGLALVAVVREPPGLHDFAIVALAPAGLAALAVTAVWCWGRASADVRAVSVLASCLAAWNLAQFVRELLSAGNGWPELPLVQRVATASVLLWVTLLTLRLSSMEPSGSR